MKLRIRELRRKRGLTLQQLADRAVMSRSHLNEVELGRKRANSRVLDQVAKALDCAPSDLIAQSDLDAELSDRLRTLRSLSEPERRAVINHASALLAKHEAD